MPDAAPAPGTGEEDAVYGLLTLAGIEVALPLSALREVVSCPERLTALPVAARGLVGAMELRELVVPVLDLQLALAGDGPGARARDGARARVGADVGADDRERSADRFVVVVADGDRLVGVLADQVRGVVRVPASGLLALSAGGQGGGPLLVSHTFRHPDGTGIVSVLDAAAVLGLPGVPTVHDAPRARDTAGAAATDGAAARRTLTLLRCGPHTLALDVAHVHTTLPGSAAVPSVLDSALCTGVTPYVDREVAVVDPLVLLGLGSLEGAEGHGAGLVLALDGGFVVLALTSLLSIVDVADADVLPVPAFSVARPDLLAGLVEVPGAGQCLVLDGEALARERQLVALGSLNTAADGSELAPAGAAAAVPGDVAGGAGPSRRAARPYITYTAGTDVATALEQVSEILPMPTTHTRTSPAAGGPGGASGAVIGVVVHRRAALPLLDLPALLGLARAETTAAGCVLLVEVDGDHVAFAVDELHDIEPLTWQDPEPVVVHGRAPGARGALRESPLIQVGDDPRLLRDLDLRALARAVRGTGTDPGGACPEAGGPAGAEPEPARRAALV